MSFECAVRESVSETSEECKRRVENKGWLSVALFCIKESAELANAGLCFRDGIAQTLLEKFVLCDVPLTEDHMQTFPLDSADSVQGAYVANYKILFKVFKEHWKTEIRDGKTIMNLFETLASRTKTLRVGEVLLHQMGFAHWTSEYETFDSKWEGEHSMWCTPLYDCEDLVKFVKTDEAAVVHPRGTTHKIFVTNYIAGMLNLDAYELDGAEGGDDDEEDLVNDGRSGFFNFTETLKALCELGDETRNDARWFTKKNCKDLYQSMTKSEGFGRDRFLPPFIQRAFSGWILKYDRNLERAVGLTPYARKRCLALPISDPFRSAPMDAIIRQAIRIHLIEVCLSAMALNNPAPGYLVVLSPKVTDFFRILVTWPVSGYERKKSMMFAIFPPDAILSSLDVKFSRDDFLKGMCKLLDAPPESRIVQAIEKSLR